jgi:tripartite-type tricarboxylate transporter receptor subunit TctC
MKALYLVALLFSMTANGQDYPTRAVRMLVGYPPGGGMDTMARVVAPKLSEALGQQFVVENRPGASGGVAAEALVKSTPDGHVLMVAESGTLALPAVNPKVTLDPLKQLAPVGGICTLPMAFVVNVDFPARSVAELIRELMPDIMSGQVPIAVISALAATGPAKGGRIRVLAVTSPQRMPTNPDWPAMAETLAGFSAAPSVFLVAPPGTPSAVIQKLSSALRAALNAPDVLENLAKQGATPAPSTSAELGAQMAEETKRWAAVVKDAGIKTE